MQKTVWIVYHDGGPDNILGVFDNEAEAHAYLDETGPHYENGTFMTPYPVPWRLNERETVIQIG